MGSNYYSLFLGAIQHLLGFALFCQLAQDGVAFARFHCAHLLAIQLVRDATTLRHLGSVHVVLTEALRIRNARRKRNRLEPQLQKKELF